MRRGIAAAVIGVVIVACGSGKPPDSDSGKGYEGVRSPCSTGTPYPSNGALPEGPRESPHPWCISRCGDASSACWGATGCNARPTLSAAPTGHCDHEGEACAMEAVSVCQPNAELAAKGTLFLVECHCRDATWACTAGYKGGDTCGHVDGGSDDGGGDAEGGNAEADPAGP